MAISSSVPKLGTEAKVKADRECLVWTGIKPFREVNFGRDP